MVSSVSEQFVLECVKKNHQFISSFNKILRIQYIILYVIAKKKNNYKCVECISKKKKKMKKKLIL